MHKRYKELCALAATSQIATRDRADLDQHLKSCSECSELLEDLCQVSTIGAAFMAASRGQDANISVPEGIRDRFFSRARIEGFHMAAGSAIAPASAVPASLRSEAASRTLAHAQSIIATAKHHSIWQRRFRLHPIEPLHAALTVVACVAFACIGYLIAMERYSSHPAESGRQPSASKVAAKAASSDSDGFALRAAARVPTSEQPTGRVSASEAIAQQTATLQQKLEKLTSQLRAAESDRADLTHKLSVTAQQATSSAQSEQQFRQQFQRQAQSLQDAEDRVVELQSDLAQARLQQSQFQASVSAQEQVAQDAQLKLADAEAQLRAEQQTKIARNQIGDLVSARNLHIVDINDHEPNGKSGRAFGRVFYVEGQSLVFYAYDLATSSHSDKKVVFHVWGETVGLKETTYSLGILHSDNPTEARWVLTFDDPKVLNRINAVYITAEHFSSIASASTTEPHGRPVLYAFLGNPNHP
jgi:flagellar biosynthesis GTPase FlhF